MTNDQATGPAGVTGPNQPKQAGDIHARWGWVEHSVWTARMLTRLEQSEPKTVWYGLWDKVISERNLQAAFWAVWRNEGAPGVDGQSVRQFEAQEVAELAKLREELRDNATTGKQRAGFGYPSPAQPEQRPLGIPAVRDRTVEAALKQVLEPIFEHDFAEHSYGFRPGRGCREAVKRVEELLSQGYGWCVELDFKGYFDTIPHEGLLGLIRQRIVDGSVLALLAQSLKAGVLEEMKGWEPTEAGTPQGAVISPLLANLYLNPLDHQMVERGWEMVRYADDLVVLCRTREEAEAAMAYLQQWAKEAGLTVHPTKTRIVPVHKRRLRLSGMALSGQQEVAAKEEPSEAAGQAATANAAHARMEPGSDRRQGQSGTARLARLLPREPSYGPERPGRMAAASPAGDAAQAGEATGLRAKRGRQSTVAQPMVCGTGVV